MRDAAPGPLVAEEAPPVVAVVVVRDPGPWFEESLAALAAQDYPALSILVVDAASQDDPTDRVAAAVPTAFVRRLGADPGYAAAANEVLKVVKGASHLLFLHDDAAPAPDAVRQMLEVAFRTNAGITSPKLVDWDDTRRLLAVGEGADPLGRPVPVVEPGELDQGQHDAEREVLVAPGACLLVRADLFAKLGGFDAAATLGGEDVDLCWRAAVAGARTTTAPAAVVRHRAALSTGERRSHLGSLRSSVARQRLRSALVTAPGARFPLALVAAVGAALLEAAVATALGRRDQARLAVSALGANLRGLGGVRTARRRLARLRAGGDPKAMGRLLARRGRVGAVVREAAVVEGDDRTGGQMLRDAVGAAWSQGVRRHVLVLAGVALVLAFGSRHLVGQPVPQLGSLAALPEDPLQLLRQHLSGLRPSGLGGVGPAPPAFAVLGLAGLALLGATGQVVALLVLGSLVLGVVGAGRLARPIGSGRATAAAVLGYAATPLWADAVARGRTPSLVAYAAAPWVLLRLLRATGLPPFGAAAAAEEGGAIDLGLGEVAKRARRRAGSRGRHAAEGPLDDPIAWPEEDDDGFGPLPEGTTSGEALSGVGGQHALDEQGAFDEDVELDDLARTRHARRGAEDHRLRPPAVPARTPLQHAAALALLLGLAGALAPEVLVGVALVAVGLVAATALVGERAAAVAAARTAALGLLGAALLLLPWSADVLRSGQWSALVGAAPPGADAPGAFDLLRLSTGPLPVGPLPLLLLAAALLPLATGAAWRATWAARCWAIAVVVLVVAIASSRRWLGVSPVEPGALLPFAAAALALALALGAAAFEVDLRGHAFGWRQLASLGALAAVAVACLPVLAGAHSGRWGAPVRDHASTLSWMPDLQGEGPFRVLWVGHPEALPMQGWHLDEGLAFGTSRGGTPTLADQWTGPVRDADQRLADPIRAARRGEAVDVGRRLAPLGVRFVVVPLAAAPERAPARAVPADLSAALRAQVDLKPIESGRSLLVFESAAWAPGRAQLRGEAADAAARGAEEVGPPLAGAEPVLVPSAAGSARFTGEVDEGEVLVAEAPSSRWSLRVAGQEARRHPAFGVLGFSVPAPGEAVLAFARPPAHLVGVALQALLWLAALALALGLAGRRRAALPVDLGPPAHDLPPPDADDRSGVVLLPPVGGRSLLAGGGAAAHLDEPADLHDLGDLERFDGVEALDDLDDGDLDDDDDGRGGAR